MSHPLQRLAHHLTVTAFGGPPFAVGDLVQHPSGNWVRIVEGQYMGEYGLSNWWAWREVLPDGGLGPRYCGYGWRPGEPPESREHREKLEDPDGVPAHVAATLRVDATDWPRFEAGVRRLRDAMRDAPADSTVVMTLD